MRQRTLLDDLSPEGPSRDDATEKFRTTVDEALAELQLPHCDRDDSGALILFPIPRRTR
jgi:hypothetical protein